MRENLDVARIFNSIIATYREHAGVLLWAALPIFVPIAVLNGAIYSGSTGAGLVLLVLLIVIVASFWYQAVVVEAVRRIHDRNRSLSVGELYRAVGPVVAPLLGAALLAGVAITLGFIVFVIPGLVLLTWWALIAPAIVIERTPVLHAFRRSRELVRGNAWQVFAVIVALWIFELVLGIVFRVIAAAISHSLFVYGVGSLIAQLIAAPLAGLAAATMFFELRSLHGERVSTVGDGPSGFSAPSSGPTPTAPTSPPPPSSPQPSAPPPDAGPPPALDAALGTSIPPPGA